MTLDPARPTAVLVSVQLPGVGDTDHAADLAELGRLVHTLGYDVVATVSQRRTALAAAAVLGEGKLKELAAITGGEGVVPSGAPERKNKARARWKAENGEEEEAGPAAADEDEDDSDGFAAPAEKATFVVVDHEISPSQARNLERATGAEVLDRTGVIVEIFHRHAKSREAKLEVEIARLNYVAPACARAAAAPIGSAAASAARARASRRWSSTSARSATASPSCARSSSGSRKSSRRAGPSGRARAASPSSATPTPGRAR